MNHETYNETYNGSSQTKFKTSMIRSNLCYYKDAQKNVKETIEVTNTEKAAAVINRNKNVTCKNCSSFINCIREIYNIQIDDAYDTNVVMTMHDLIQHLLENNRKVMAVLQRSTSFRR